MKRHDDLIQTDIFLKKTDEIMTEFMTNIQEHELNWKENITENKSNKNIEISDENSQFRISSNKKFEKKEKDKKEK